MAASRNISYFLRNVQLLLKDINERLHLTDIFCVTASRNISCIFRNVRLLLKDIKKNERLFLNIRF